jgi:hypothetical protein
MSCTAWPGNSAISCSSASSGSFFRDECDVIAGRFFCLLSNLGPVNQLPLGSCSSGPWRWLPGMTRIASFVLFDLGNAGFNIYCGGSGNTHFILDTIGYFLNNGAALTDPGPS